MNGSTKPLATKGSLARIALEEIADDDRAHRLRAASVKFQRRLHDIETAYFEAQTAARSDYLAEVAEINGSQMMSERAAFDRQIIIGNR
ncbi:MAG TPA: hypothetical protein VLZ74_01895 [Methylocella sp.]|nr:hypothetical protein [Methylocella sp.]